MRKLPIVVATVGLMLTASLAQAAPDQRKDGGPTPAPHSGRQDHHPAKPAKPAARADRAKPSRMRPPVTANRNRNVTTNVHRNVTTNVQRNVTKNVQRNVTRKVDVTRYRRVVRATRRFRAPRPWVAPRGFAYRRFGLGERIPFVLLAAPFFLNDFSVYGLEAAPYGYVWVRDGSDAVLVNRATGEVIQVQYDIFY